MERKLEADENFARKEGEKHGKKINDRTKKKQTQKQEKKRQTTIRNKTKWRGKC